MDSKVKENEKNPITKDGSMKQQMAIDESKVGSGQEPDGCTCGCVCLGVIKILLFIICLPIVLVVFILALLVWIITTCLKCCCPCLAPCLSAVSDFIFWLFKKCSSILKIICCGRDKDEDKEKCEDMEKGGNEEKSKGKTNKGYGGTDDKE